MVTLTEKLLAPWDLNVYAPWGAELQRLRGLAGRLARGTERPLIFYYDHNFVDEGTCPRSLREKRWDQPDLSGPRARDRTRTGQRPENSTCT